MRRLFNALFCLICLATTAPAHNNFFLPGDAFFSISISQKNMIEWAASTTDTLELNYERFDGEFFVTGDLSYTKLSITGVTPEFRSALAEAYWRFSKVSRPVYRENEIDGKVVLEQINSVVALIYSKDTTSTTNSNLSSTKTGTNKVQDSTLGILPPQPQSSMIGNLHLPSLLFPFKNASIQQRTLAILKQRTASTSHCTSRPMTS